MIFFFLKQNAAYEMRISDWSSDVCSSDLPLDEGVGAEIERGRAAEHLVVLGDDRLGHADEAIDVGGVVLAVDREAEGVILVVGAGHLPLAQREIGKQIGRASCRERVCQYV